MKFWTTGKLGTGISLEVFQPVMAEVEKSINELISGKDYGEGISTYAVAINIFQPAKPEKFLFNASTGTTNIDVNIDHEHFIAADARRKCLWYLLAVIYSIDQIKNHPQLTHFHFDLFRKDLVTLLARYQSFA